MKRIWKSSLFAGFLTCWLIVKLVADGTSWVLIAPTALVSGYWFTLLGGGFLAVSELADMRRELRSRGVDVPDQGRPS